MDDIDADFRVFFNIHGVADGNFGDLSSERFFALACRTAAYQGSMCAVATFQQMEDEKNKNKASNLPTSPDVSGAATVNQEIPLTQASSMLHPAFKGEARAGLPPVFGPKPR